MPLVSDRGGEKNLKIIIDLSAGGWSPNIPPGA
jgi:hypothetical protein